MNIKYKPQLVGILGNESPDSVNSWTNACKEYEVNYKVINLASSNWLDNILKDKFDFFVIKPPGSFEHYKNMYDERLYIITKILGYQTYPSYEECIIYENKKMLSYFLKAKNIPHPKTTIFYKYEEAKKYIEGSGYPFVAKTSIGATGSGVEFIDNKASAQLYIKKAFKGKGIHRRFGPNRVTGNPKKWLIKAFDSPKYLKNRLKHYFNTYRNVQKNYVIFQEHIPHEFEWKLIKIGGSYFAHKKIKVNKMASGGKVKEFGMPDSKIMDFVENLCKTNAFNSVDVDIFEYNNKYLVNEIQCIFGIPYGYLTKVDNETGRLIKINGEWQFEKGDFAKNDCCNIKLENALELFCNK